MEEENKRRTKERKKERRRKREKIKRWAIITPFQKWEKDKKTKGWRRRERERGEKCSTYKTHGAHISTRESLGLYNILHIHMCVCAERREKASSSPKYNLTMRVSTTKYYYTTTIDSGPNAGVSLSRGGLGVFFPRQ